MAIHYAGHCMRGDGKRNTHHQRRSQETLFEVESALQKCAGEIRGCATFHELHELIYGETEAIIGAGPLLVYDAATVIAANLGLNPDRIYLHSGTARVPNPSSILAVVKQSSSELPSAFMRLHCYEIEDCLCLYKRELALIARQKHRTK